MPDSLRVDTAGVVHPLSDGAARAMQSRTGTWRIAPSPRDALLLRREGTPPSVLKLAGEIASPGALCDVVALIAHSAWSGELIVVSPSSSRSLYFDGGNVVGATSNLDEERLGASLARMGVITREQLATVTKATKLFEKSFAEAAVDLGFLTLEQLYPLMARQVEEVFYAAMQMHDGHFYLFDRFEPSQVVRCHNMNAGALLMEAACRMDETKYFREKIPSDAFVPVPTPGHKEPPEELGLVFSKCDGKRDIRQIGLLLAQPEFEVTRAVFQLVSCGFLVVIAPQPTGSEAIVGAFNPALVAVHRGCDAAGKGVELRTGLSRYAEGAGVLFKNVTPLADGALPREMIAKNLAMLASAEADAWLAQQLHEYVGFALLQAGSLLAKDAAASLGAQVTELLKPLRQAETCSPVSRRGGAAPMSSAGPPSRRIG